MHIKESNRSVSFLEQIDSCTGTKFSGAKIDIITDDKVSWKAAICCVANNHIDTPLMNLGLSTRVYHSLRREGYDTVGSVLLASINELEKVRNFGILALEELQFVAMDFIMIFVNDHPNWRHNKNITHFENLLITETLSKQQSSKNNHDLDPLLRNIFSGAEEFSDSNLQINNNERLLLIKIKQAIDEVGFDICSLAYHEPRKVINVLHALSKFIVDQIKYQNIHALVTEIPESRLTNKLYPYVNLYSMLTYTTQGDDIFEKIDLVKELDDFLGYLSKQKNQRFITEFLKWLSFDLHDNVQIFIDRIATKGKQLDIITQRASGETLEEISNKYSVTRERIRQIENQTIQEFRKFLRSYPLLSFISAELNGETIVTFDDISGIVPNSEIISYLLKKNPDRPFAYDKRLSCFYLPGKTDEKLIDDLLSGLPAIIFESEKEKAFQEIKQKTNVQEKLIYLVFKRRYKQVGKIWHTGRLSKGAMFGFVIEKYFPHGIKVYEKRDLDRLRNKINEVYGEGNDEISDRACWGIIQRVCVLCDRGKYIHPSYVSISDDLLQRIESYFINSGRTSMTFHELFDEFEDELIIEANITNRYLLQGLFKDKIGDRYYYFRDGISTDPDIKITGEIETYVRENSPVTKQELMTAFSGITEAMLAQSLGRLPSIILLENGTYADAEKLDIIADDYKIRFILQRCTKKYPITASKLLESLYLSHPGFLQRNDIHLPDTLFSILQYMFSEEFSFSRPYISSLEEGSTTSAYFLLQLLNNQEEVNIDDLSHLCEDHHIKYPSQNLMISALMDHYLQVDGYSLLNIKKITLSPLNLNKIRELVFEDLRLYGFKPLHLIDNFIFYPDIGSQWTPILLRSITIKYYSSCFNIINNRTNRRMETDIIIDKKLDVENYKDLVQFIVRREQNRDPFTSFDSLISWLVELGLVNNKVIAINEEGEKSITYSKLPNFLTDGSFIMMDRNSLNIT